MKNHKKKINRKTRKHNGENQGKHENPQKRINKPGKQENNKKTKNNNQEHNKTKHKKHKNNKKAIK